MSNNVPSEELDSNFEPTEEFMRNASEEYRLKLLRSDPEKNKKARELYRSVYYFPPAQYVYNISTSDDTLSKLPKSAKGLLGIDEENITFVDDELWYNDHDGENEKNITFVDDEEWYKDHDGGENEENITFVDDGGEKPKGSVISSMEEGFDSNKRKIMEEDLYCTKCSEAISSEEEGFESNKRKIREECLFCAKCSAAISSEDGGCDSKKPKIVEEDLHCGKCSLDC